MAALTMPMPMPATYESFSQSVQTAYTREQVECMQKYRCSFGEIETQARIKLNQPIGPARPALQQNFPPPYINGQFTFAHPNPPFPVLDGQFMVQPLDPYLAGPVPVGQQVNVGPANLPQQLCLVGRRQQRRQRAPQLLFPSEPVHENPVAAPGSAISNEAVNQTPIAALGSNTLPGLQYTHVSRPSDSDKSLQKAGEPMAPEDFEAVSFVNMLYDDPVDWNPGFEKNEVWNDDNEEWFQSIGEDPGS